MFHLFLIGLCASIAIGIFRSNPSATGAATAILMSSIAYTSLLFTNVMVLLIVNIFWSISPWRDILTHFVAIGTAIVEDEVPAVNPVSKTLIFYPLTNH